MPTHARPTGRPAALFALLLALVLVAGCSWGDDPPGGLGSRPADEIVVEAQQAARSATSVHIVGSWVVGEREYRIDLRLKTDGATGRLDTGGQVIELLRVGTTLFVRGDEELYQVRDGTEDEVTSAEVLRDKFVKVPEDDPAYARLSPFTQPPPEFVAELFRLHGKVRKNGRRTVREVPTIELVANKGHGGELFVATEGVPFPMRYSPSPTGGRLDLFEYNLDFPVTMPPAEQILDYGDLSQTTASPSPGASPSGRATTRPTASANDPLRPTDR